LESPKHKNIHLIKLLFKDLQFYLNNFTLFRILFHISDKIFCGSNFIKNDIIKKRVIEPNKLQVTGFPLDLDNLDKYRKKYKKENIVLFSARNVDEKQPWLFDQMKKRLQSKLDCEFINTQELDLNKDEFYKLVAKSKVMISFALQENFGFSMLEANYLGCKIVVPNRLVYPELYDIDDLYNTFDEACDLVINNITNWDNEYGYFNNNITFHDCFKEWFRS